MSSDNIPIKESLITTPINPYGSSKLFSESIIKDVASINSNFKYVILRYFNVAGADLDGKIGECHNPETHLLPLIVKTALGKRESIKIFGDDYNTPDGTCIRDYIHVTDLSRAHILALKRLEKTGKSATYNLGNGNGFSVKEIIRAVERVTGKTINLEIGERRAGDPATLIASSKKAIDELAWEIEFDTIEKIIETAWNWHKSHVDGYGDK